MCQKNQTLEYCKALVKNTQSFTIAKLSLTDDLCKYADHKLIQWKVTELGSDGSFYTRTENISGV